MHTAMQRQEITGLVSSSKLNLFGGKGGVGKTTVSCALAVQQARLHPEQNILLVSLDPAHSILNLFDEQLKIQGNGNQVQHPRQAVSACGKGGEFENIRLAASTVESCPNLHIQEFDFTRLNQEFSRKYGEMISSVMERGSLLSAEDLDSFLQLSPPSIGDLMSIMILLDLIESKVYNMVIADTAPTGHTLRFLGLPDFLSFLVSALNLLEAKHRLVMRTLVGNVVNDKEHALLDTLNRQAGTVAERLHDPVWSGVFAVTLAEQLSIAETERFVEKIGSMEMSLKGVLINQIANENCPFCSSRYEFQKQNIKRLAETPGLQKLWPDRVFLVPLTANEPRDSAALMRMADSIRPCDRVNQSGPENHLNHEGYSHLLQKPCENNLPDFVSQGLKLVIFAGKGGVGKTTISAASGIHLAQQHPNKRILIVSIDPAHSLGDSLDQNVGSTLTAVDKNLFAIEIDAPTLLAEFKDIYASETLEALTGLLGAEGKRGGMSLAKDREIAEKLLGIDSPDLDEFMVFRKLQEYVSSGEYDCVILDPAPSGHLLRFLSLPELAKTWISAALKVIYDHHMTSHSKRTVEELLAMLRNIKLFQEFIADHERARLVAVTSAREGVIKGTKEMLKNIDASAIDCDTIIVNVLRPPVPKCEFCSTMHEREERMIKLLESSSKYKIMRIWLEDHEVRGSKDLADLGGRIYAG